MEGAATIAALEFAKRKAIYEIENNYDNDFLHERAPLEGRSA